MVEHGTGLVIRVNGINVSNGEIKRVNGVNGSIEEIKYPWVMMLALFQSKHRKCYYFGM